MTGSRARVRPSPRLPRPRPAVALACALAAFACGGQSAPEPVVTQPARHLILVTIDTLRADRLGCYGSTTVETPHLDRLAREGVLAADATVHSPLTRPSHASLLSGLYPAQHGVRDNLQPLPAGGPPLLADVLRGAGFRTAAFVASVVLGPQAGLTSGFDTYSARFDVAGGGAARFLHAVRRRGDVVIGEAIGWLRAPDEGRLFAWIHLYDPHDPYEPPEPYATRYGGRPYDGTVAWSDSLIGQLDAALEASGLRDGTLLVVTSDHGEALGEHGEPTHGFFVYESTLRVPLILRGPGIPPGLRVEETVRTVDLYPTLLELLGVPAPDGPARAGRSVAAVLRGGAPAGGSHPTFAESLAPRLQFGWSELHAVRDGRWKYILAPNPELYDVAADPGETANLIDAQPARARALHAGLQEHLAGHADSPRPAPPPEAFERLGALGYIGAGGPPPGGDGARADPKDKIDEYTRISALIRGAILDLHEQRHAASARGFRAVMAEGVDSFEAHYYLGRALAGMDRCGDAAGHFERAIERLPSFVPARLDLAACRLELGDRKAAIAVLREAQHLEPDDPRPYVMEADLWDRARNRGEAIRAYEALVERWPDEARSRVRLGELYRDAGESKRAIAQLREAVRLDPDPASYWNALGMVLGGSGDPVEAERAFREAVARNAEDPQYLYNLGFVLQRQGRRSDAAPLYRRVLELEPRFEPARERLAELERP